MARRVNAPQLNLNIQAAANREWEQMMADLKYHAANPAPQHQEQPAEPMKIYSFDVLINGKLKHTYTNIDRDKALKAAHWRAKLAAKNGWPTHVRPAHTN